MLDLNPVLQGVVYVVVAVLVPLLWRGFKETTKSIKRVADSVRKRAEWSVERMSDGTFELHFCFKPKPSKKT